MAWEEIKLKCRVDDEILDKYQIERILREELEIRSSTPEVIESIQVGLLLSLQANLQSGRAGPILFGHKSFREFLVARYWADRLRAIAREPLRQGVIEKSLLGGRLLGQEDRSFAFLIEMLNTNPERRRSPGQPFGLSKQECSELFRWAENRFQSDEWMGIENHPPKLRNDLSPWLREAALAIGSCLTDSPGMRQRDALTLRSIDAWFWLMTEQALFRAPRAKLQHASMSELALIDSDLSGAELIRATLDKAVAHRANFSNADLRFASLGDADFSGADFSGANLSHADLRNVDLIGANLSNVNLNEANLNEANLSGANLHQANLRGANLNETNLLQADLSGANLSGVDLVRVKNFQTAKIDGARYSSSTVWGIPGVPMEKLVLIDDETEPMPSA